MPAAEAAAAISPDAVLSRGVLLPVLSGVTRIAVAVSGGSDSMALLRLAALLPDGPEVIALTIDHGLRDGSRAEADQVARWCAGLGIPHHILAWAGAKPATGIQAKAREARYDLLTRWCTAHCVSVLLTAHTLDDQAETVLMRKRRTASAASLAAIWPERPWNGVRLLRPLLAVRREALRNFLRGLGQGWLEDPATRTRFSSAPVCVNCWWAKMLRPWRRKRRGHRSLPPQLLLKPRRGWCGMCASIQRGMPAFPVRRWRWRVRGRRWLLSPGSLPCAATGGRLCGRIWFAFSRC